MSAPLLTPLDSPIFDEDVITEMEDHSDEEVMCMRADAAAIAQLLTTCCSAGYLVCEGHLQKSRETIQRSMSVRCKTCRHECLWPTFDDVYRVVPL
jgi:hypothetical protein